MGAAWNGAIYSFGIVTLVFAVLERERVRITTLDNWNPSKLPKAVDGRTIPRGESVAGVVFATMFFLWWLGVIHAPMIDSWDGQAIRFAPAQIWTTLYYPILLSLAAAIAIHVVDLVRPWRTLTVSVIDLTLGAVNVAICVYVIRAGRFVEVIGDPANADTLTRANYFANAAVEWSFIVLGAVFILDMLYEIWVMTHAAKSVTKHTNAVAF